MMRPPSKAATRRTSRAAAEPSQREAVLPPALDALVEAYRPKGLSDTDWAPVAAEHRQIMLRCGARTASVISKYQIALGGYLVWRAAAGLSVAQHDAMTFRSIDDYYRRGLSQTLAPTTANDYRARLRRIAQHANPGPDAPLMRTAGHIPVRAGYTAAEEAALKRVALRQRRPRGRQRLCALIGLAAGAGLASADLRHLTGRHVVDLGEVGIRVDVPGKLARTVWVRQDYEELVRAGLSSQRPSELLLGVKPTRRNITGQLERVAELYDAPPIDAARLRTTWLSWLMLRPVPIAVVLDAAGLTSARTLTDLLPTLPPAAHTGDALRSALR